jgi:hypothetical protein
VAGAKTLAVGRVAKIFIWVCVAVLAAGDAAVARTRRLRLATLDHPPTLPLQVALAGT